MCGGPGSTGRVDAHTGRCWRSATSHPARSTSRRGRERRWGATAARSGFGSGPDRRATATGRRTSAGRSTTSPGPLGGLDPQSCQALPHAEVALRAPGHLRRSAGRSRVDERPNHELGGTNHGDSYVSRRVHGGLPLPAPSTAWPWRTSTLPCSSSWPDLLSVAVETMRGAPIPGLWAFQGRANLMTCGPSVSRRTSILDDAYGLQDVCQPLLVGCRREPVVESIADACTELL